MNAETRQVRELKPNNPKAIGRGWRKLQRYIDELINVYGGERTGDVVTY